MTDLEAVLSQNEQLSIENDALRAEVARLKLEVQDAYDQAYFIKSCAQAELRERTKALDRLMVEMIEPDAS